MTPEIKNIIKSANLLICPYCDGEGELEYFCGHDTITDCYMCGGKGVVKSLNKQLHRKTCSICNGESGARCCNNKGFHEWESYELLTEN